MLPTLILAILLSVPAYSEQEFACSIQPTGTAVHVSRSATSARRGKLPGGGVVRASRCLDGWCVVRAKAGRRELIGFVDQAALMDVAAAQAVSDKPGRLAMPGVGHHAGELGFSDGDQALAICGSTLVETRVKVVAVEDVVLDGEGRKTGQEASAEACPQASWLVATPRLRPRVIHPATIEGEVARDGATIVLGARAHKLYARREGGQALLVLNGQEIARAEAGELLPSFGVRWAGDLDGDGALDLIVDLSASENASEPTLFLSSAGPAGRPALVASQRTTGC